MDQLYDTFVPKYVDLASQLGEILFGLIMVLAGPLTAGFVFSVNFKF